ncbi:MAG: GNAT family N-acetyltransferase [Thermoplasmata archaeon]|nr:GNAT family N-acetyltransferase [Thermoplasmata archaeon]
MTEYRRASADDIDQLVKNRVAMRLEREEGQCPVSLVEFGELTRKYFIQHMGDGSFIAWVAENDGRIVGTSGMCIYHVPPTYSNLSGKVAYLVNMYTVPEYRNQGIANGLLERLIGEARERGCTRITLNASKAGQPIYEDYGFTEVLGEMEYFLE